MAGIACADIVIAIFTYSDVLREGGYSMAITVLLCYASQDKRDKRMAVQLKNHLSLLERNQLITVWDSSSISPGYEREQELGKLLDNAQIILLLVSASFLASHYCYKKEMLQAIERHERKEARVIPVIIRSTHWEEPPLDKLEPLPASAKPIAKWEPQDDGFKNVVDGIRQVITQWNEHSLPGPQRERQLLIEQLDRLIEAVKTQMQPPPRAIATANTLQQLSVLVPNEVTLADLIMGWQILSHSSQEDEEPAIAQRRVTCRELAQIASQFTSDQGDRANAIKTWRIWRDAFEHRNDPRQDTMAKTFARELTELQNTTH